MFVEDPVEYKGYMIARTDKGFITDAAKHEYFPTEEAAQKKIDSTIAGINAQDDFEESYCD